MTDVTIQAGLDETVSQLSRRTGLSFTGSRGPWLRAAVGRALGHHGAALTDAALTDALAASDDAFGRLCDEVTVRESYFFREPAKLEIVRREVLPRLRRSGGPVRVWSAGCASGEEAYTLAILLARNGFADRSRIIGTDLSAAAVSTARAGVYGRWALRGLDPAAVASYFTVEREGFRVRDGFRSAVSFQRHNLLDSPPWSPGTVDLVLCRNVLIYLTPDAVERAVGNLTAALAPGGWLVTSASDPLLDGMAGLEPVVTEHGMAYRRRDSSRQEPRERRGAGTEPAASRSARPRRAQGLDRRSGQRLPPVTPEPRESMDEMLAAAERALELAHPAVAVKLAQRILEADPGQLAGHRLLLRALGDCGRLGDATAAAEAAATAFPLDAQLRYLRAVLLLELGEPTEAATAARQAIYLDPDLAGAHLVLARCNDLLDKPASAERARRAGRRLLSPEAARGADR